MNNHVHPVFAQILNDHGPSRALLARLRDAEAYVESHPLDKCQNEEERERLFWNVKAALELSKRVEAARKG